MSTLTSALGWTTSTASNYVDVQVFATNSDGTSPASSFTADATSSTLYVFAPQIAPTIAATTSSTTQINVVVTCLTGADAGFLTTGLKYVLLYKLSTESSWRIPSINETTCSGTQTISVSGLTAVSTYEFAMYATNDIGTGPTTATTNYEIETTYGAPSQPARPTLVQNNDMTVTLSY